MEHHQHHTGSASHPQLTSGVLNILTPPSLVNVAALVLRLHAPHWGRSFLEMGEAAAQGAARETMEEANAHVHSLVPFSHLDIPVIGQAYLLFRYTTCLVTPGAGCVACQAVMFIGP